MGEEVMERVIMSIIPEKSKRKEWSLQNSPGKSILGGPLSPSSSDDKILSRYLRPSMGSCHDLCKYGKKHATEAEEKHSMRRRFLRNNIIQDGEQKQVSVPSQEGRKNTVMKSKNASKVLKQKTPLPGSQIGLSETPMDNKLQMSLPSNRSITSAEKTALHRSRNNEQNHVRSPNTVDGKKTQMPKPRIPLQPKPSSDKTNVIKLKDPLPSSKTSDSGKPDIIKKKSISPVKKSVTSTLPKVRKQKAPPSMDKTTVSSNSQCIKQKAALPPKRPDTATKTSISLKKKAPLVRSISQLNHSRSLRRNQANDLINSQGVSKLGEKRVLKSPMASFSSKSPGDALSSSKLRKSRIMKRVSYVKKREIDGRAKHDNSEVKERKLDNTEPESKKKYNKEGDNEESGSAISEVSDGKISSNKTEASKRVEKRRTVAVPPDDNVPAPYKLKFRRGKVIDLRSESIRPKRIRFRRIRVAGDNPSGNSEIGRRSFRRRRDIDCGESNSEAQSVILKHQGTQEKKDVQVLFNNVIEETASKLVESRKSKVKALVSAFETVISLQERKPASAV